MNFLSEAQEQCYQRFKGWMDKLFGHIPWETLDEPGFGLFMGSAWVEVHIYPWKEDAVINIRSTVATGTSLTPDLLNYLLRENAVLRFGAFSINQQGDVLFEHTIVGSTCDPKELETSVIAVLKTADDYDDPIVSRWGGKRAIDQAL